MAKWQVERLEKVQAWCAEPQKKCCESTCKTIAWVFLGGTFCCEWYCTGLDPLQLVEGRRAQEPGSDGWIRVGVRVCGRRAQTLGTVDRKVIGKQSSV